MPILDFQLSGKGVGGDCPGAADLMPSSGFHNSVNRSFFIVRFVYKAAGMFFFLFDRDGWLGIGQSGEFVRAVRM